jgi:hypothetical protein
VRRLVLAALPLALLACRPHNGSEERADVFVPSGDDGGEAEAAPLPEAALGPGQVDRAGHPLVTVLLIPGSLADEYNEQSSFEQNVPRVLQDALEARLVAIDTWTLGDAGPDPVDWPIPDGGTHPLLPMFTSDVLLVDTALSCANDAGFTPSYLDIEREIYLGAAPHTTCGGRTPNENVVDETLTLLVTDGRVPVSQGVPGPSKPAAASFPYLADPN